MDSAIVIGKWNVGVLIELTEQGFFNIIFLK